ncbi:hypothetical protein [Actinoplanes sp. L3-i22]|uniref:hypothetical protein n=1 Tax=Actinoplanes sp. L3-i22 TaxID=2836373 RepID=UPI001C7736B5|nr:hypothetical protein [Actinoplanes sp. L3-i22]BCY08806.1 hypothetical protein L3i22_038940 [Actinoplanes sp. L3-i22]
MSITAENSTPAALRARLTAALVEKAWINTPAVRAAFEAVPRHLFVPDTVAPAAALITAWDRDYRDGPTPEITVHPTGTPLPGAGGLQLLVPAGTPPSP